MYRSCHRIFRQRLVSTFGSVLSFKMHPRHSAKAAFAFQCPSVTAFAANALHVWIRCHSSLSLYQAQLVRPSIKESRLTLPSAEALRRRASTGNSRPAPAASVEFDARASQTQALPRVNSPRGRCDPQANRTIYCSAVPGRIPIAQRVHFQWIEVPPRPPTLPTRLSFRLG
jgi:hypothetical protein